MDKSVLNLAWRSPYIPLYKAENVSDLCFVDSVTVPSA